MRRLAVISMFAALVAVGCTSATDTTTSDPSSVPTSPIVSSVAINNFNFTPGDLTVRVGSTVEWQNRAEGTGHTTTSDDGLWDSSTIRPGGDFSRTFDEAGTFTYFCAIHPSMTGTVIVTNG